MSQYKKVCFNQLPYPMSFYDLYGLFCYWYDGWEPLRLIQTDLQYILNSWPFT